MWLKQLIDELKTPRALIVLYCDDQGTVCILDHSTKHQRIKHIVIKYLKIRDLIKSNGIVVEGAASSDNIADILTEPLVGEVFSKHRKGLGDKSLDDS